MLPLKLEQIVKKLMTSIGTAILIFFLDHCYIWLHGYVSVRSPKEVHAYLSAFLEINSSSQIEKIITIHMTTRK